jgi:hypothetical protein
MAKHARPTPKRGGIDPPEPRTRTGRGTDEPRLPRSDVPRPEDWESDWRKSKKAGDEGHSRAVKSGGRAEDRQRKEFNEHDRQRRVKKGDELGDFSP